MAGPLLASGSVFACLAVMAAWVPPAMAQAQAPADDTIVVIATRPIFDVAPERSLDEGDVETYGLSSVGEVLDEIAAESGDTREDPVFLVNGKRVSGLGDVEDLPAEAISKVEVLPVGSGIKVGASSSQRVYNISLKRELDTVAARASVRVATRGSWSSRRGDVGYTHIRGNRRVSVAVRARDEDMLLESERDVVQPTGAITDAGRFRSLSPRLTRFDFTLSAADQLTPWLDGSLTAKLSTTGRTSLLAPFTPVGGAPLALEQLGRSVSGSVDAVLNATVGSWVVSAFGNYSYARRRTITDRATGLALPEPSTTISREESLSGLLTASGPLFELPAGPLRLTASAGVSRDTISGERRFQGATTPTWTGQTTTTLSGGIEVPLTSRSKGFLPFLGDLTASAEFTRTNVSDFGSFITRTFGFTWRPADWIRLNGSISRGESAPKVALIDEPLLETPGVLFFDPLRNETATVTRITGGVPGLLPQSSRSSRIGANIKPIKSLALQLTAEYLETSNRNLAGELPAASPAILAAFPDRFIRDASGRLIVVDARTVVLASRNQRQLRLGMNLSLPLGRGGGRASAPAAADDDDDDAAEKPTPRGARPRLQFNLSHTWLLASDLTIAAGGPRIDLLSPQSTGFGGLGQPRHRFDLGLGYSERGFGMRLTTQHRTASFIEAGGAVANVLRFEPLTTFDLRAWVQGTRLFPNSSFAKGTRLTLSIQNLTDVRERVIDSFGATPLAYQPAYRDPIGRTIQLELRKTF